MNGISPLTGNRAAAARPPAGRQGGGAARAAGDVVTDALVTVITSTGHAASGRRPATALPGPVRCPACEIAVPCREHRDTESAYVELKPAIPGGRAPTARAPLPHPADPLTPGDEP